MSIIGKLLDALKMESTRQMGNKRIGRKNV